MEVEKAGANLSLTEEQAFNLSRCAITLDQSRQSREKIPAELVDALNENLQVWIAIRTMAMRDDTGFPDEVKENLQKLSKFVAEKTFENPKDLSQQTMDTLVNINLQISEGLLEGLTAADDNAGSRTKARSMSDEFAKAEVLQFHRSHADEVLYPSARISQVASIFSAARRRFCYKNHEVVACMERWIWHTRWVNRNRGAFGSFLTAA